MYYQKQGFGSQFSESFTMGDRYNWGRQFSGEGWQQGGRGGGGMGRSFEYDMRNGNMESRQPARLMDLNLRSFRSEYDDQFPQKPWGRKNESWNQGSWGSFGNRNRNAPFNRGRVGKNDRNKKVKSGRMKEILNPLKGDNPFYCMFCKVDTKNRKVHLEHVRSASHTSAEKRRKALLNDRTRDALEDSEKEVFQARMDGRTISYCSQCYCHYAGKALAHKNNMLHKILAFNFRTDCKICESSNKTRFAYEKHLLGWRHIRNRIYKMNEEGNTEYDCLEYPEEYDEDVHVGNYCVVDVKALFCKVCQQYFSSKGISVTDHCKTREHYEKFKAYAEAEKVEREKKKEETSNEEKLNEDNIDEEEKDDKEMDDDEGKDDDDEEMNE